MTFNFKALAVFFVFWAVFGLLLHYSSVGEPLLLAVGGGMLAAASVVAVVLYFRRGSIQTWDTVVPRHLRRWMLGERRNEDKRKR